MPMLHPAKQVYKTHNRLRWIDAHLDHAVRKQILNLDRDHPLKDRIDDAISYMVIPVIETGRVVIRVQFWFEERTTATILREPNKVTDDVLWRLVEETIATFTS